MVTIDEAGFHALYLATARDVLAYVRRRTTGDPEAIVAETYAVAWRRRKDLPVANLRRAWLFGVARNLLRESERRRRRDEETVDELATRGPHQSGPSGSEDRAAVVNAALARLDADQRELLRLVSWEGLTPAELAVALGIRAGTARVRLHRARVAFASDPEVQALVAGAVATRPAESTTP